MTVPPTPIGVLNAEIQQMETTVLTKVRSWWDGTWKQFETKPRPVNSSVQGVYSSLQAAKFDPAGVAFAPNLAEFKLSGLEIGGVKILDFFDETRFRNWARGKIGLPRSLDLNQGHTQVTELRAHLQRLDERLEAQKAAGTELAADSKQQATGRLAAVRTLPEELQRLEERINDLAKALG